MSHPRNNKRNPGFGQRMQPDEGHFTRKLKSKAAQGMQGYPVATIAYYGPNLDFASKVAVSVVQKDQQVAAIQQWLSDYSDMRLDPTTTRAIVKFIERHRVKSVIVTDTILGCPHEEGIDYPEGKSCPQCPFWENRNRWTGEIISPADHE